MNKLFKSFVLLFLVFALVACSSGTDGEDKPSEGNSEYGANSLYLITDVGTIDDKSFNQGSWEGLVQLGEEIGVEAKYLQPAEKSTAAYSASIAEAANAGAKIIVTPGFLFENAVHAAQAEYPEVKFILIDGEPRPEAPDADTFMPAEYKENTVGVLYQEEQSGFLAGYAAVKEGLTKLGFMGGMAVPAVVRFGYGFVAGADYAAAEMGVKVDMTYTYLNSFNPDPQFTTQAQSWYNNGTEAIFVAAGGAGNSVMAAAEAADKWVIGVDVDQKDESERVLTSAMKNLKGSVYAMAKSVVDGTFEGGKTDVLTIDTDMVQISDDLSRFTTFTQADLDKVVADLKADKDGIKTNIPNTESGEKITDIKFENVTVSLFE